MRLSRIKLAGFKSFVDPTTITLPSNLVGIVGPNGCGKSNVIDAVRWVMGEASAKHLRGDSMADVIFNGSASRKPVGTATIELHFDNSDGAIGGQYANYAEITIKRSISRDGTSQYFLNNTRCRRKDITDLFLGTGLGSRSYAIIEQGMVSRLIEAKPDEMRSFIEEAAGISRYKERRRETENRIQHTRDNLARLNDLREEVAKQIDYLQRQAKTAERYKELKREERRLEAELYAIRLAELDGSLVNKRRELERRQTDLESAIAAQRRLEAQIVAGRERHVAATEAFNEIQARYYATQSEISRLEQAISHARELRERQRADLEETHGQVARLDSEVENDQVRLREIVAALKQLAPDLDTARRAEVAAQGRLREAEAALGSWQGKWHEFNLEAKEQQQARQVEQTRIEHLQAQLETLRRQASGLDGEQADLAVGNIEQRIREQRVIEERTNERVRALGARLTDLDREIEDLREYERRCSADLELSAVEIAARKGQLATLQAVQRAALGAAGDEELDRWLDRHQLAGEPRLAQQLRVEKGWALAVETVLGDFLHAVCVPDWRAHITDLPAGPLALLELNADSPAGRLEDSLLAKVANAGKTAAILGSVRTAENLAEALQIHRRLAPGESVVTVDGIWLGDGWVRVRRGQKAAGSLLTREEEMRAMEADIHRREAAIATLEQARSETRARLAEAEETRVQLGVQFNSANREHAEAQAVLDSLEQEAIRTQNRRLLLDRDAERLRQEMEAITAALSAAHERLGAASAAVEQFAARRPELQRQQEQLLGAYNEAREQAERARERVAQLNIEYESRRVAHESLSATLARIISQRSALTARVAELERELSSGDAPLGGMQAELSRHLAEDVVVESDLASRRQDVERIEHELRAAESERAAAEKAVSSVRECVDALRIEVRELEVRREGLLEQLAAIGAELSEVQQNLVPSADEAQWQASLEDVRRRIERLGPINLAAIEQYSEQAERKKYLDAQFDDLTAALDTLEQAIRKIDRETRSRFQETFENINQGLKRIFPRLFGGGHAYLSLEGDDILSAGVTVMARPPGKRNSHIHLLSGGEKALTAVALIFSIFELNPAPFCLLDEVDAPLDDANVGRFCEIVREMSQRVQFVVITHNKTTMEMANQLTGVTMNEPGVSRLVSVDLDEAIQLAAS